MNKIYRVIWNRTFNRFVVVNEFTQSRGKTTRLSVETDEGVLEHFSESFKAKLLPVVGAMLLALGLSTGGGKAYARVIGVEGETQTTDLSSIQIKDESQNVIDGDYAFNPFYWDDYKTESSNGEYKDNQGINQTVEVKGDHTLTGRNWKPIKVGEAGFAGSLKLEDIVHSEGSDVTVDNKAFDESLIKNEFNLGGLTSVVYIDQVTGKEHTAQVYKDFSETTFNWQVLDFAKPNPSDQYDAEGERLGSGQYVDKVFFTVDGEENALTVSVGNSEASIENEANLFNTKLKSTSNDQTNSSSVFHATNGATINYASKTLVQLALPNDTHSSGTEKTHVHRVIEYTGETFKTTLYTFVKENEGSTPGEPVTCYAYEKEKIAALQKDGYVSNQGQEVDIKVDDLDSLKQFNEYLISQLGEKTSTGSRDETWYQERFNSAFKVTTQTITVGFTEESDLYIPSTDSTSKGSSEQTVAFIHTSSEDGEQGGHVVIKEGAQLAIVGSQASLIRVDGAAVRDRPSQEKADLLIEKGAYVGTTGSYGWIVNAHGGLVVNEGTVGIGSALPGSSNPIDLSGASFIKGFYLQDQAWVENNGVINMASLPAAVAVEAQGGSTFINGSNALINLWNQDMRQSIASEPETATAIKVNDGSEFKNEGALVAGIKELDLSSGTPEEINKQWYEILNDYFF